MIDPLQDRQFKTVFSKFDRESRDSLTWSQFQEFVYSIGLKFLIDDYLEDIRAEIFDGDFNGNRATYEAFKDYVDQKTKFEEGPDQYEKDMAIFDEDHNGKALIDDVRRVCKDLAGMSDDEVSRFIKKCLQDQLTDEQKNQPLESLNLPEHFVISTSTKHLYNV